MKHKSVIPREQANRDIEEALAYCLREANEAVALGLIDALEQAFDHISRHPASGSSRYGHELGLPGLGAWSLKRYPYIIFYVELPDCIDVWRVLQAQRDIPVWLRPSDPT